MTQEQTVDASDQARYEYRAEAFGSLDQEPAPRHVRRSGEAPARHPPSRSPSHRSTVRFQETARQPSSSSPTEKLWPRPLTPRPFPAARAIFALLLPISVLIVALGATLIHLAEDFGPGLAVVWGGWNVITSGRQTFSPVARPQLAAVFWPAMPAAVQQGLEFVVERVFLVFGAVRPPPPLQPLREVRSELTACAGRGGVQRVLRTPSADAEAVEPGRPEHAPGGGDRPGGVLVLVCVSFVTESRELSSRR